MRSKKGLVAVVSGFVALGTLSACGSTDSDSASASELSGTDAVEYIESNTDAANVVVESHRNQGRSIYITFDLSDSKTNNDLSAGARTDTFELLKSVDETSLDVDRVLIKGSYSVEDVYGNADYTVVVDVSYEQDTISLINFDNRSVIDNIWRIADKAKIHADL
ncbi:MAG: hypothetical protein ACTHZ5_01665 [Micrococcaceae bacterium]